MSIRNLEVENRTKYGLLHRFWIFLKGEREKFDIFGKESSGFKVLKEKIWQTELDMREYVRGHQEG